MLVLFYVFISPKNTEYLCHREHMFMVSALAHFV